MTQYKTVIIPTPFDDSGVPYSAIAESITMTIQEQAKDGWEVALAQEMESGQSQGLFASLFGGKKKEKHTLLVFKKEEEKPAPEPAKEFDYDRFEQIVNKGVDYDRFANMMKKVVSETEVTISAKSFEGINFTAPVPALPMNGDSNLSISEAAAAKALPDKRKKGRGKAAAALPDNKNPQAQTKTLDEVDEEKSVAIAKLLYEIFKNDTKGGITYPNILKECEGKLPEGCVDADVGAILRSLVDYKKVIKDGDLFHL